MRSTVADGGRDGELARGVGALPRRAAQRGEVVREHIKSGEPGAAFGESEHHPEPAAA